MNIDFLIAGTAILIVVIVKLLINRGDSRFNFKSLTLLTISVLVVFAADFFVSGGFVSGFPPPWPDIFVALLLIMQCAAIMFFSWHVIEVTGGLGSHKTEIIILAALPFIADSVLLLTNFQTHAVFSSNPNISIAISGQLRLVPVLCMGFYAVLGGVTGIVRRRSARPILATGSVLFAMAIIAALAIEHFFPSIRMVSFALALGLGILASAELNPFEYIDTLTHALDMSAFRQQLISFHRRNRRYSVILVSLDHLSELRLLAGSDAVGELITKCAVACRRVGRTRNVYRVRSSVFALFAFSHREERRIANGMEKFFQEDQVLTSNVISPTGQVVVLDQSFQMPSSEQAIQYIEFIIDKLRSEQPVSDDDRSTLDSFIEYRDMRRYLERAMDDDLFEVYYQPSWCVKEQGFCSLEALARLPHPERGVILPTEFIGIAEREGFIAKLDRLQFVKICRFIQDHGQELESAGIKSVKVNLSPADLVNSDLAEWLLSKMDEYGVDPNFVQFEITETSATQYNNELARLVSMIAKSGSSLIMDDFGSGYANLKMVLSLPFSVVKLDQSLLESIEFNEESGIMYSNIVAMLHGLGFIVVAEGAETEKQVNMLRSFGVDQIQGFFFSEPLCEEDLLRKLGKGQGVK